MAQQIDHAEGTTAFHYATLPKPCETWYKILGKLDQSTTGRPLICLHGGPGASHIYQMPLQYLVAKFGVTIVLYDQIGCGNSTHLPETKLDDKVWKPELFMAELDNLRKHLKIDHYDLLGHSWGGMLAAMYAMRRPQGLHKLIISNSPASMEMWVESCNGLRAQLPREIDSTLTKYEALKEYDSQAYKDAVLFFYKRHLCRKDGDDAPFPKEVMKMMQSIEEDDTVYFTMNGPSEFTVVGNLKKWSAVGQLSAIDVPTLVLNGEFDEAQALCVKPYADEIPNNIWKTIPGTSHMSHVERTEEYCQIVADFLLSK